MHSSLRVGFLSSKNYFDRRVWSGILYYMYRSLSALPLQMVPLGNPKPIGPLTKIEDRLLPKPISVHSEQAGSPRELQERFAQHLRTQEKFARHVRRQLKQTPCDVIFAPAASSELFALCEDLTTPIVYLSDTTFKLLSENYPQRYTPEAAAWLDRAEAVALAKAERTIFSSSWAAQSAVSDYHVAAETVTAIPFGANIDAPTHLYGYSQSRGAMVPCRLLLVGRDWHRKGGDIAVETLKELQSRGIKATLTIVGCVPPEGYPEVDGLEIIPYLDKNKPEHRQRFEELLSESHLFLLPTRADCSPIVICEANAFGLPAITTDVGGLPELIAEGKNGYALSAQATAADFANKVVEVMSSPEGYHRLVRTTQRQYDKRFGWQAWGRQVRAVLQQVGRPEPVRESAAVPMLLRLTA